MRGPKKRLMGQRVRASPPSKRGAVCGGGMSGLAAAKGLADLTPNAPAAQAPHKMHRSPYKRSLGPVAPQTSAWDCLWGCMGPGHALLLTTLTRPGSFTEALPLTNRHQPSIIVDNRQQTSPTLNNRQQPPTTANKPHQPSTTANNRQQTSPTLNNRQQPPTNLTNPQQPPTTANGPQQASTVNSRSCSPPTPHLCPRPLSLRPHSPGDSRPRDPTRAGVQPMRLMRHVAHTGGSGEHGTVIESATARCRHPPWPGANRHGQCVCSGHGLLGTSHQHHPRAHTRPLPQHGPGRRLSLDPVQTTGPNHRLTIQKLLRVDVVAVYTMRTRPRTNSVATRRAVHNSETNQTPSSMTRPPPSPSALKQHLVAKTANRRRLPVVGYPRVDIGHPPKNLRRWPSPSLGLSVAPPPSITPSITLQPPSPLGCAPGLAYLKQMTRFRKDGLVTQGPKDPRTRDIPMPEQAFRTPTVQLS